MQKVLAQLLELPWFKRVMRVPVLNLNNQNEAHSMHLLHSVFFKHACKTPLTTLMCSLDLLAQAKKSNSGYADNISVVKVSMLAAQRLAEMISLLDAQQNMEGKKESFEVLPAIRETLVLAQNAECGRKISLQASELKPIYLQGPKLFFQEALSCIINNAFEAYSTKSVEKLIVVYVREDKNRLRIEVIDFGKGMSASALKLAWVRGLSYKKEGTGLGLHFVEHAVKNVFNGTIRVMSQPRLGTRVWLELPFALTHI